tara:strand:+ start:6609 stop:6734 length:126 start_codon:yes stop_codon:yes gene_type:complete
MKKVTAWAISVEYGDGSKELITEIPNGVAQVIDDWITEEEK